MAQHWRTSPVSTAPCAATRAWPAGDASSRDAEGGQNRVRMPIVPTIWFAVLDAPPDVLMNAW